MSELAEKTPGPATPNTGSPAADLPPQRGFSMAFKLTLLVGLTLTLLLAGVLTGSWFYWRNVLRAQVDGQLSAVAASRRDTVQAQVALLLQRMTLNTDRGEVRGFLYELAEGRPDTTNRASSQASLHLIADGRPILSASVTDATGRIVLSSDPAEVGRKITASSEFQAGLHEAHLGWPRAVGNRFEATLAAPIRTRADPKRVYGTLIAKVDVSDLAAALRENTGLGRTGEAILAARSNDRLHFLFPPRNAPETTLVPLTAAPALAAATEGRASFFKTPDYRGVPVLAASQPIAYRQWALVVKMDEVEAYAPVQRALRLGVLSGLEMIALGLVAAYLLTRRFTRPVRRLAEAAARVASGDYASQVPVQSADELGELSASFNAMTAAIHARGAERDVAEAALRETDRRKDEFLAMLSHELRNPLSAIANAVRLEQDPANDPEATAFARGVIARQAGHLNRLVDDLLDVARITRGKIELRRRPVELSASVNRSIETVRPLFAERRHQLERALTGSAKSRVDADPTRLEQIVTNLLTNAAKYTPDGGRIIITERQEGRDAVLTVTDDGIGIAPEMLPKIFDLFTQADRSLDRTAGGLGLGLSLCRQLVELHGGTISAHSSGLGKGATFTVRLPLVYEPEAVPILPPPTLSSPDGKRRRILLVDDNEDTVRSLSRLLTRRGHEVTTAFDGLTALEVAREFQPNILLLDIGLPGLDGYSLARRLRTEGFAETPMIAISGYAQERDRARSREAGFNHHFAKPVDFEALAELIVEDPLTLD